MDVPSKNRCITLKNSHFSMAIRAEHRSEFAASPSLVTVTSTYELKILEIDNKKKQTDKQGSIYSSIN